MQTDSGLEHVVAADTVLSEVDGAAGRLILRGAPVEALAGRTSFEQNGERLLAGFFADLPSGPAFTAALGRARVEAFASLPEFDDRLRALPTFEVMRALTARLSDGEDLATALRLIAAPAVFASAAARVRAGEPPVAPDEDLGHAADVLRMIRGGAAGSVADAAALDAYLVTVSDHGLNASTFAARVAASTRAGLTSSVLAGMSTLVGPFTVERQGRCSTCWTPSAALRTPDPGWRRRWRGATG